VPNCVSYDPAYAYELAVIVHDGLKRMFEQQERVFYYITCMNENYMQPAMPKDAEEGILRGAHRIKQGGKGRVRVQLLGSGTILREVLEASALLQQDFDIPADVWSVTSFNILRREAMDVERWNRLHPMEKQRRSYVEECFGDVQGPMVAATDYMAAIPDQIRQWVPDSYLTLGTDGYGRSDGREALRRHFEVDRYQIVVAALRALADEGSIDRETVGQAITRFGIDPEKPNPVMD